MLTKRRLVVVGAIVAAMGGARCRPADGRIETYFDIAAPVPLLSVEVTGLSTNRSTGALQLLDTQFSGSVSVASLRGGVIEGVSSNPVAGAAFLYAAGIRDHGDNIVWRSRTGRVAYSRSIFMPVVALGTRFDLYGVSSAFRLFVVRDAVIVDSIVLSGDVWREARPPVGGHFIPDDTLQLNSYLRRVSIMTGAAILADSVVVINVGTFRPTARMPYAVAHRFLTVLVKGRPVVARQPSPGELVAYNQTSVFFIVRSASATPGIQEYRWRGE